MEVRADYDRFFMNLNVQARNAFRIAQGYSNNQSLLLNVDRMPPPVINMHNWMRAYQYSLGVHSAMNAFVAENVIEMLRRDRVLITSDQETGILGGAALTELGKLTFDPDLDQRERDITQYPAIGSYIYWMNTSRLFQTRKEIKMTLAGILYHQLDFGSGKDIVFEGIKLRELIPELPVITKEKYRKVATLVALVNAVVSTFEIQGIEKPEEKIRGVLDDKIRKILRHFRHFQDFDEDQEMRIYFLAKNRILQIRSNLGFVYSN